MPKPRKRSEPSAAAAALPRLARSMSLVAQTEQSLRVAIAEGQFPTGRLPTEVELAEQLGVSRETVRLATEVLEREGLLIKIRRRGTFLKTPGDGVEATKTNTSRCLGYLQADYPTRAGAEEAVTAAMSGLMLQGALAEAGQGGFQLLVKHTQPVDLHNAIRELCQGSRLEGVIFASCGEDKAVKRAMSLGLPVVLLDHDLNLPRVHSVRDDSLEGARQAIRHLASLGHRCIGFVDWRNSDLNPWRLRGYRQGLRDAKLPRRLAWEIPVELSAAGAAEAVEKYLGLSPRPSALFCFNNTLARFIIDELSRRGLRVPEDVSIMGAGGESVPGLTATTIDWREMGRLAVQILRETGRKADAKPEHRLLEHKVTLGWTCAKIS